MALNLKNRLADAKNRRDSAAADLPRLLLDGEDAKLTAKRRQWGEATADVRDIEGAIELVVERERDEREQNAVEHKARAVSEARDVARQRVESAGRVDKALAALETAVVQHEELGHALANKMTEAGYTETARIARSARQNLRWATWRLAETTAELAGVPFANVARRQTLAELDVASTPNLE